MLQALDEVMGSFQVPENYARDRAVLSGSRQGACILGSSLYLAPGCAMWLECIVFMLLQRTAMPPETWYEYQQFPQILTRKGTQCAFLS